MRDCDIITFMVMVISLFLSVSAMAAEPARIAVLYPESSGGYEQVFNNMIEGIEQTGLVQVLPRELSTHSDIAELSDWLLENKIQAVITLGSVSYDVKQKLPEGIPVIVGAMVVSPDGFDGISLAGHPSLFLDRLQAMVPAVERVFIIYNRKNSGWLIDLAREQAKMRDIELIAYEASNIKQGLKYYDQVLDEARSTKDAIWLPLDRIVPDKAVLPKILKMAWDRDFVVFSNNPLHVKQGVLFALYPDHKLMGKKLGELAVKKIGSQSAPALIPASDLKIAVNKRTASHLDLHFTSSQLREFNIVFPSE